MNAVAKNIAAARKAKGLSAYDLDKLADLATGHVASIEAGRRHNPRIDTVAKIAKALGVSIGELFGELPRKSKRELAREKAMNAYIDNALKVNQ